MCFNIKCYAKNMLGEFYAHQAYCAYGNEMFFRSNLVNKLNFA